MAFKILARTREQTTTTGTGDITVSGLISSDNVPFSAGMSVGDSTFMCVVSGDGISWEEFLGTYSAANTIVRSATLINNSGTTTHINLSGTSRVFAIIPSDFGELFNKIGAGDITKFLRGDGVFGTAGGTTWHYSVAVATAAALPANTYNNGTSGIGATITANSNGVLTVDGFNPPVDYRVLVKDEATLAHNGIYIVTQAGDLTHPFILTRANDYNSSENINQGDAVIVGSDSVVNGRTIWTMTIDATPVVVGTTHFDWSLMNIGDATLLSQLADVNFTAEAAGDLIRFNGSLWENFAAGSNGQVLTVVSGAPAWAAAPGGSALGSATTIAANNTSGTIQILGIGAASAYKLILSNLQCSVGGSTATLQFGIGGTPTWVTVSYCWTWHLVDNIGNHSIGSSDSDTSIHLLPMAITDEILGISGEFLITNAGDNSSYAISGHMAGRVNYSGIRHGIIGQAGGEATLGGALTALRLVTSAGNWQAGKISIMPITL